MAFSGSRRALLYSSRPGWAHPKAALSLDFLGNRAWRAGSGTVSLPSALTTVRASSHLLADSSGALQEFSPNTLATLPGVGAYIGEQAAEEIRNARGEGGTPGVIGSGGVAPTNWSVTGTGAWLTATYHGAGVEDGWPYTEWEFAGTNNTGSQQTPGVYITTSGYATTAPSQPWNLTLWAKYIGTAPTHALSRSITENASGGVYLRTMANAADALTNSRAVYSSRGTTGADTASVRPAWFFAVPNGQTLAARIRVYAPQMVNTLAAPAPPVLPPVGTPGDSARLASDVRAIASGSEPFAGWTAAGLDAGHTILADVDLTHVGDGVVRRIAYQSASGDYTVSRRLSILADDTVQMQVLNSSAGQDTKLTAPSAVTAGRLKVAARFQPGAHRLAVSGRAAQTNSSARALDAMTGLMIGASDVGPSLFINDTIRSMQVCKPLTDAEMDAWVAA